MRRNPPGYCSRCGEPRILIMPFYNVEGEQIPADEYARRFGFVEATVPHICQKCGFDEREVKPVRHVIAPRPAAVSRPAAPIAEELICIVNNDEPISIVYYIKEDLSNPKKIEEVTDLSTLCHKLKVGKVDIKAPALVYCPTCGSRDKKHLSISNYQRFSFKDGSALRWTYSGCGQLYAVALGFAFCWDFLGPPYDDECTFDHDSIPYSERAY